MPGQRGGRPTGAWIFLAVILGGCGGGGSGGPDGGGAGASCGGFAGLTCDDAHFCDYADDSCGAADGAGTCRPRPEGCDDSYEPVCGCDGTVYSNACDGEAAGSDVNANGGCTAPADTFGCGFRFCAVDLQYCQHRISDIGGEPDDFACVAMPPGCDSCACLTGELCGAVCDATGDGFTLTCEGG